MTPLTQTFINWLIHTFAPIFAGIIWLSLIAVVSTLARFSSFCSRSHVCQKHFMLQLASRVCVCVCESWQEQFLFRGFMFDTWAVWNTVASACRVNVFCTTNLSDAVCSSVCCHVRCAAEVCRKSSVALFCADVFFSVDLLALQCLREPSFPHSRWRWSLRC